MSDSNDGCASEGSKNASVNREALLAELNHESERRGFLRRAAGGVGAALASTFGLTGTVAGHDVEKKSERMALAREYHNPAQVLAALETTASETLAELSERGHLDSASATHLPTDELHDSVTEFAQASKGAMVFGILRDGDPTVRIEVKRRLRDGTLKVVVLPERDHSFAVISYEKSESGFGSVESNEVISTSSDCDCVACYPDKYCGISCGPYSCGCLYQYWPTQCCTDCCYTGDSCSGCDEDYC